MTEKKTKTAKTATVLARMDPELKKQADAAAKEEARLAKLSPEKRKAEEAAEARILEEFNALRKAAGREAYQE